jgi:hypothetical protein
VTQRLLRNQDEIGNAIQPYYGADALDLTTGEVVGRLQADWAADIKAYDEGHVHMLQFADMLTEGVVKQFPDRFPPAPRQ